MTYTPPPVVTTGVNFFTQTGPGDDVAPILESITLDKSTINTSSKAETVVATITVGPEQWGESRIIDFRAFSPATFGQFPATCTKTLTKPDGSTVYSCSFTVPLGAPKGLFSLMLWIADDAGNRADYRTDSATGTWWTSILNESGQRQELRGLNLGPVGVINGDN